LEKCYPRRGNSTEPQSPSGQDQHAIQIQPIHWIVDQNRSNEDKVYVRKVLCLSLVSEFFLNYCKLKSRVLKRKIHCKGKCPKRALWQHWAQEYKLYIYIYILIINLWMLLCMRYLLLIIAFYKKWIRKYSRNCPSWPTHHMQKKKKYYKNLFFLKKWSYWSRIHIFQFYLTCRGASWCFTNKHGFPTCSFLHGKLFQAFPRGFTPCFDFIYLWLVFLKLL